MGWRKWNYALHRDIGYVCVGLTLIYALSGVLVNHMTHDFNPSYTILTSQEQVAPLSAGKQPDMTYVGEVLTELGELGALKNVAMMSPQIIRIFVEGNTIDVNLETGIVQQEKVSRKPLFFEVNYLHLNKHKGLWTWLADIYAVALAFLALSGMLMIRGKRKTRSIVLTAAGFAVPVVFLFFAL